MANIAQISVNDTDYDIKDSYARTELGNKASKSSSLSLTATSAGWSNGTQTLTATGVTASNNIQVGTGVLTSAQYTKASAAKIRCTAQAANSITLTCYGTAPDVDLPITVIILG